MLGGGDQLARGARKAQFSAGKSKKGDKVQINPGMVASEKDRATAEKETIQLVQSMADAGQFDAPRLKSKLTPLYDRVIIRKTQELERSKGGIFIPADAQERPNEGTVLYVGFGRLIDREIRPLYLKGGERVLFGKYAGTEIKVDNEAVLLMREDEVLAVIDCPDAT